MPIIIAHALYLLMLRGGGGGGVNYYYLIELPLKNFQEVSLAA